MAGHNIQHGNGARIVPSANIASTTIFLSIILLSAGLFTFLCLRRSHAVFLPIILLLLSAVHSIISAGLAYSMLSSIYLALRVGLDLDNPSNTFIPSMISLSKRLQLCSALIWAAIYLAKASFVLSFRPQVLASQSRFHKLWFYLILTIISLTTLGSIPLSLSICADFTSSFLSTCPVDSLVSNTRVYLSITSALDVITTILTASIPVTILAPSSLAPGRRFGLAFALFLSLSALLAAILRSALSPLHDDAVDLSWLVFAFGLTTTLNVLLATLPSIPTLFPQSSTDTFSDAMERSRTGWSKNKVARARSRSRDGVLKVEVEVRIEEGPIEEGRMEPPTPNKVMVGRDERKRVSRMSEEMWERLVRGEEERDRVRGMQRRVEMFMGRMDEEGV
ncbi:MAG: hypothetical protein MMC23_000119 [Stictis urceolatum]|nr:hypothetical protein [Stictis urceolata]